MIVILTMGRSGSSMVAGALAAHGVWTGECHPADEFNPRGYFENARINQSLGRLYRGGIYHHLAPMKPRRLWPRFVRGVMAREEYLGGPALVKVNAFTWPMWLGMDPLFVLVRRDVFSIVRSALRHDPVYTRQRWARIARAHHAEMDRVRDEHGGIDVDTSKLVAGDHDQLTPVLDAVGVRMDRDKIAAFVEPAYWHGQ